MGIFFLRESTGDFMYPDPPVFLFLPVYSSGVFFPCNLPGISRMQYLMLFVSLILLRAMNG